MKKQTLFKAFILIIALFAVSFGIRIFNNQPSESEPHSLVSIPEPDSDKVFGKDTMIFALYGQSKATDDQPVKLLNDLVLVFSYNPKSKKSVVVTLPTQLYLERQSKEQGNKLSLANGDSDDKVSETNQAVQEVIQLPIDRYIGIDLDKFAQFVDDVEGLAINEQTLSGSEVKAYLQENLEDADTTAQFFDSEFDALVAQANSPESIANPEKRYELLHQLLSVKTRVCPKHGGCTNDVISPTV